MLFNSCLAKFIVMPANYFEKLHSKSESEATYPKKLYFAIVTNEGRVAGLISKDEALIGHNIPKETLRIDKKPRISKKQQMLRERQKEELNRKIKAITEFLKDKYETTQYFYDEIQRIEKTRVVKDELRKMVNILETSGMKRLKEKILRLFRKEGAVILAKLKAENDFKNQKPNNFNIPIFFDTQA